MRAAEDTGLAPPLHRAFASTAAVRETPEDADLAWNTSQSSVYKAPSARTAPRGLMGLLDGSGGASANYQPLDTESLPRNIVLVNVYDLGEEELFQSINRFSTVNDRVLLGGIYHAGVEVYGSEWSFGGTDDPDGGVFPSRPRLNFQHTYRATVVLGQTQLTEKEVLDTLLRLKPSWRGTDYNLLHKNCLDFANAFCCELGVGRMPGWIDRFGRTASTLDNLRTAATEKVDQTKVIVRHLSSDVESRLRIVSDEVPKLAEAAHAQSQMVGANLCRWGRDLFSAVSRALVEDQPANAQEQKGGTLRASLRNRGGVRLASSTSNAHSASEVSRLGTSEGTDFAPPARSGVEVPANQDLKVFSTQPQPVESQVPSEPSATPDPDWTFLE